MRQLCQWVLDVTIETLVFKINQEKNLLQVFLLYNKIVRDGDPVKRFDKPIGMDIKEMVSALPVKIQRLYFGLLALGYTQYSVESKRDFIVEQLTGSWSSTNASVVPTVTAERTHTFTHPVTNAEIIYYENGDFVLKNIIMLARFTKEELKLLDGLEINLDTRYSLHLKQSVDDWWNMK